MDESVERLLVLTAEVSIATVALSGITMLLSVGNIQLKFGEVLRILGQLTIAGVVAIFAMVPLFLNQLEISPATLWRIASLLYLLTVVGLLISGVRLGRTSQTMPTMVRLTMIQGTSGLILLPMNFILVSVWPYLIQLFVAWIVSLVLFRQFIADVLNQKAGQGDT